MTHGFCEKLMYTYVFVCFPSVFPALPITCVKSISRFCVASILEYRPVFPFVLIFRATFAAKPVQRLVRMSGMSH